MNPTTSGQRKAPTSTTTTTTTGNKSSKVRPGGGGGGGVTGNFGQLRIGGKRIRMAEDREVLRSVWNGKIPVSFQLSQEEVYTLNVPEPFYLMVPRLLYLPLCTDKIRKHFIRYINPESVNKEIWFEYNGQPIKWHLPIGLWFDLYAFDTALPWTITVHFEDYPETQLLRILTKDTIRTQFMSTIKEADALKHKGQVINSMQERDHHALWQGFQSDRFDQFWSVNKKLMESVVGEGFRNIPIRCYTPDKPLVQRLIKPIDETTGDWTTLQDALLIFFQPIDLVDCRVIIHGVEPPLDTPVQWLSEHFSYPDNFIHVALIRRSSDDSVSKTMSRLTV